MYWLSLIAIYGLLYDVRGPLPRVEVVPIHGVQRSNNLVNAQPILFVNPVYELLVGKTMAYRLEQLVASVLQVFQLIVRLHVLNLLYLRVELLRPQSRELLNNAIVDDVQLLLVLVVVKEKGNRPVTLVKRKSVVFTVLYHNFVCYLLDVHYNYTSFQVEL